MLQPKSNIEKIALPCHGGINFAEMAEQGIKPEDVLDFSVCTNPFGPPPGLKNALREAAIDRYPDGESSELTALLASQQGVSEGNIIVGSGSTELIRCLTTAYLGPGTKALVSQPSYSEYALASRLAGADVMQQELLESHHFRLNVEETVRIIENHHPHLIFICNPNNPTGRYLSQEEVGRILKAASQSLVVLDEAYIAFTRDAWRSLDMLEYGNLIVLRSMTKDYALAGLRLGYAVASGPVISVLKKVRPPWNVNIFAQIAGVYALRSGDYLKTCGAKLEAARNYLVTELLDSGFNPWPSQAHYFLVKVGNAFRLREALLKKGILVRDCASFGLPEYIRLSPRTLPECETLIKVLRSFPSDEVDPYAG